MLYIISEHTNPAFNLAMEEHLLKNSSDEFFIIGSNDKSVIVGKHQNAVAEINAGYLFRNNIPVFRRISGGGTVYHDPGNLNFAFIMSGEEGKMVNFRKHTQPVIDVMRKVGLEAKFGGLNNLTINGLKISGNAEHIHKNRLLHHGTLLYKSDLNQIRESIRPGTGVYVDKSVKSIRSKVANIMDHLVNPFDIKDFASMIIQHIKAIFPGAVQYHLSEYDLDQITKLKKDKYDTWEWNIGYSPPYTFKNSIKVSGDIVSVYLSVKEGIITDFELSGNDLGSDVVNDLRLKLIGQRHDFERIPDFFTGKNSDNYFPGLSSVDILKLMF